MSEPFYETTYRISKTKNGILSRNWMASGILRQHWILFGILSRHCMFLRNVCPYLLGTHSKHGWVFKRDILISTAFVCTDAGSKSHARNPVSRWATFSFSVMKMFRIYTCVLGTVILLWIIRSDVTALVQISARVKTQENQYLAWWCWFVSKMHLQEMSVW